MKFFKKIFWSVYQVEFTTIDQRLSNIQFFRGLPWEVIQMANTEAKEKSEREKRVWTIKNMKRI